MSRRKGKTISFDAMVKFFMQNYNIPTKKDVDHLMARLDRLENLIKSAMGSNNGKTRVARRRTSMTAAPSARGRSPSSGACPYSKPECAPWR